MSRAALAASFVLAWVLIAACGSDTPQPETHPTGTSPATATATAATPSASPSGTTTAPAAIQHVFVIVLENESGSSAIRDPYLAQLAGRGARLTNYTAVAHPSQPNYIAMIAGATLVSDDATHNLKETNLVDLLDAAHVSWKAYMEGYPGFCFPGASATTPAGGAYVRKHNPFISFDDIRTDARRCANIVDAGQLDGEIAAGRLPAFSFYTPNLDNDGHDTSLGYASKWLKGFLEPKLSDPRFADGTLVIVTFDEGDGTPATDPLYTVLLGPMVSAGSLDSTPYTHYSLLRTVESVFGLPTLGRGDAAVTPFAACNFEGGCGR